MREEEDNEELPPTPEPIEWLVDNLDCTTPFSACGHDVEPLVVNVDQWKKEALDQSLLRCLENANGLCYDSIDFGL